MNENSPDNLNGNKFSTREIIINPSQEQNYHKALANNESNKVLLVTSTSNDPPSGIGGFSGIPPHLPIGGGAVVLIIALTAYSKSQMKSINELAKTLLKREKKE